MINLVSLVKGGSWAEGARRKIRGIYRNLLYRVCFELRQITSTHIDREDYVSSNIYIKLCCVVDATRLEDV
jgi:hypothetical protein